MGNTTISLVRPLLLFCVLGPCLLVTTKARAQVVTCVVATRDSQIIGGFVKFKDVLDIQNNPLHFITRQNKDVYYPASQLKEVLVYLSAFDTLHLRSVPKSQVLKYVDIEGSDTLKDTHMLIKTDLGLGPVRMLSVCSNIDIEEYSGVWVNGHMMNTPYTKVTNVYKDFLVINDVWTRLPDIRYDRNDVLIQVFGDCPSLTAKLLKKKINPMKKMDRILYLYNHCK